MRLEEHGQLDMIELLARQIRSPEYAEFSERVKRETGLSLEDWVRAQVDAKRSLREMAGDFGIYHATLWRWIRRRMPGFMIPTHLTTVTEDEVRQVTELWRGQGISSNTEISERLGGMSIEKIRLAKRICFRQSRQATNKLYMDMMRRPWSSSPRKRGATRRS